jgi:hypothetical protein
MSAWCFAFHLIWFFSLVNWALSPLEARKAFLDMLEMYAVFFLITYPLWSVLCVLRRLACWHYNHWKGKGWAVNLHIYRSASEQQQQHPADLAENEDVHVELEICGCAFRCGPRECMGCTAAGMTGLVLWRTVLLGNTFWPQYVLHDMVTEHLASWDTRVSCDCFQSASRLAERVMGKRAMERCPVIVVARCTRRMMMMMDRHSHND